MQRGKQLWALTSYYNPAGYRQRYENFRRFSRELGVPLIAVELSFDGAFELPQESAEILVQVDGGDILWQKERLLNIALDHLPEHVEYLAWIDSDILIAEPDWDARAVSALQEARIAQLFRCFYDLPRGAYETRANGVIPSWSIGHHIATGRVEASDPPARVGRQNGGVLYGGAWAARAELLRRCRFYDVCVIGSGDLAMSFAATGNARRLVDYISMNEAQQRHYHAWAEGYREAVGGRVGYVDTDVYHLWHGDLGDRRYLDRHRDFRRYEFDPERDLARYNGGAWRWSTDKPEMHGFVRSYFESRREDG